MKLEIEEELKQRNKELLILNTVISYLNQFLNIGELLEGALEKVLEIMAIESGALLLLNDDKSSFVLEIAKGFSPDFVAKISSVDANESTIGKTLCSGNHLLLWEGDDARVSSSELLRDEKLNTLFCLPIKTKKKVYGMMMCGHRYSRFFSARNMNLLESIGAQIALMIENAMLFKNIKRSEKHYQQLIEAVDVGIISFSKEGKILLYNKKAEDLFGFSRDEALNAPCTTCLPEKHARFIEELARDYVSSGSAGIFEQPLVESAIKKDGMEIALEISYAIWGEKNQPTITATIRDMRS
jgi:PAS domain S-box-containing protein